MQMIISIHLQSLLLTLFAPISIQTGPGFPLFRRFFDSGASNPQLFKVNLFIKHTKNRFQSTSITPFAETAVNTLVRRITAWNIFPRCSSLRKPENCIQHRSIVPLEWPSRFFCREQFLNPFPLRITDFISFGHLSSSPDSRQYDMVAVLTAMYKYQGGFMRLCQSSPHSKASS